MALRTAATPPEPPRQLRPLARTLDRIGFRLAVPFDDIRRPGYIGLFEDGRELILDDGTSLAPFVRRKARSVAMAETSRRSRFSLKGFLKVFGGLAGLDVVRAKSVSIRFPSRFVPSEYISITDVLEDMDRLPAVCRDALRTPGAFLIVQTIETDAIEYVVEARRDIDAAAQDRIGEAASWQAQASDSWLTVRYESERRYAVLLSGKTMTVAYKPYRLSIR